ncbi:hypothetical protein RMSM_06500 [Rhodopirellula maiorica SM1]|uniref:Uncharacterized protein n=1 Tax=Rhodopirellula maiorica SM1 TaxID=1265738 RepID=M5RMG0_9BACT|nr:hypothetical protein [Rhodopirellula maiorica]EMI16577.1 hypothetical protein RMSM_06500 [Rhodopirellula maiorica SM1]
MTTSSDLKTSPNPSDERWHALAATISPESTDVFGQWVSDQLKELEARLGDFESPRSVCHNLRG